MLKQLIKGYYNLYIILQHTAWEKSSRPPSEKRTF